MTELEKLKMNDDYINQNDIVKRYLHNKLTPEETVEFEEYMLDKPELLERLELDMVLMETLPKMFEQIQKSISNKKSWWTPILSHVTALAACTGLITVLFLEQIHNIQTLDNFSPQIVYLETYRSKNSITPLVFSPQEKFKVMIIDVPPKYMNQPLELIVRDNENRLIIQQEVQPFENESITFLLNRNALEPTQYLVSLSSNNNIFLSFPIKVILKNKEE